MLHRLSLSSPILSGKPLIIDTQYWKDQQGIHYLGRYIVSILDYFYAMR